MSHPRIAFLDVLSDPLAALGRAREEHWLAEAENGALVALRHQPVRELLADSRLEANFVSFLRGMGITSGPFYEWMAISPLNHDGEQHQRWRALMARTFTPRSVERLRPFLRNAAHELIDGFVARGGCEFVTEFADVFPSLGMSELIGVPLEDRERFRGWANTIGLGFNPLLLANRIAEVDAALGQLLAYTAELAARRIADPRDDLVTRIALAGREEGWTDFEAHGFIAGLVFAGHETTKNQLGWLMALLAGKNELWDAVAAGSPPAAQVVEEVLRHRSAVTAVTRTVPKDLEHAGEKVGAGTTVMFSLWSANHDPAAFPRPDELAPAENRVQPHLAFGHGAHHCLGAALARAELQEALLAFSARVGCPRLGEGATWKPPVGITGPETLPIRFEARAGGAREPAA